MKTTTSTVQETNNKITSVHFIQAWFMLASFSFMNPTHNTHALHLSLPEYCGHEPWTPGSTHTSILQTVNGYQRRNVVIFTIVTGSISGGVSGL